MQETVEVTTDNLCPWACKKGGGGGSWRLLLRKRRNHPKKRKGRNWKSFRTKDMRAERRGPTLLYSCNHAEFRGEFERRTKIPGEGLLTTGGRKYRGPERVGAPVEVNVELERKKRYERRHLPRLDLKRFFWSVWG